MKAAQDIVQIIIINCMTPVQLLLAVVTRFSLPCPQGISLLQVRILGSGGHWKNSCVYRLTVLVVGFGIDVAGGVHLASFLRARKNAPGNEAGRGSRTAPSAKDPQ